MSLLTIYFIGAVMSLILAIIMCYLDYKHGYDITLWHIYFSLLSIILSWLGAFIWVSVILTHFSNKVIIKGKEDAE